MMSHLQFPIMPQKLKLLCMHGFGTSKEFMQMQAKDVVLQLADLAEFYFIDGPTIVPKNIVFDPVVFKYLKGPPRNWFYKRIKTETHEEVMKDLQTIRQAIEAPGVLYDGAFCFSQGAMAFQFISVYHKLGHIKWKCFESIRFFMNFSSVSVNLSFAKMNWQRFQIPSLHILSPEDIYFSGMMLTLTRFKNPEYILHSFGHKFPALGMAEKRKIIRFMRRYGYGQKEQQFMLESKL